MAQTLINLVDSGGNSYFPVPSDLCREDFDGNLFFTIDGMTSDTNIDAFTSHPAYVNHVDNMDGTFTFEMNPDLLSSEECITLYEETPTPCVDECPEISFRQGNINAGEVPAVISINHDDLASVDVNGNVYSSNWLTEYTAPTGDCVIYVFEITSNSGCVWNFTITLPACEWFGSFDDCLDHNECTVFNPSMVLSCDNATGLVTITPDYDGGTPISETFEYQCENGAWNPVVGNPFNPNCIEGNVRWMVELDDSCGAYEIIEPFICPLDCENTTECVCVYDPIGDTFTISCTDSFASAINTDTLVYFIDGGIVPNAATLGVPIPATGITRIDWQRTVNFSDTCPDLVVSDYCAKVDDCDYTGFNLTCDWNTTTMTSAPTITGDVSILTTNNLFYSIDGGSFTPYLGGSVHANIWVVWKWEIKIEGCDKEIKIATCGDCDKCSDIDVTLTNTADNPIYVAFPDCIYVADCVDKPIECQEFCIDFSESADITEITLQSGTLLSADVAFNFPYLKASSWLPLFTDLQTWLNTNGGGTVYFARDNVNEVLCVKVENATIDFGTVTTNKPEVVNWIDCEPCPDTCVVDDAYTTYDIDGEARIDLGELAISSPASGQTRFTFSGTTPINQAADFKTAWDTELAKGCDFLVFRFLNETPEVIYSGLFPNGSVTSVVDNLDGTVDVFWNGATCGEVPHCCNDQFESTLYYPQHLPVSNPQCMDEYIDLGSWANPVLVSFQCINLTPDCCPNYAPV